MTACRYFSEIGDPVEGNWDFIVAKGLLQRLLSWQSHRVCRQYRWATIIEMGWASWPVGLTHNIVEG